MSTNDITHYVHPFTIDQVKPSKKPCVGDYLCIELICIDECDRIHVTIRKIGVSRPVQSFDTEEENLNCHIQPYKGKQGSGIELSTGHIYYDNSNKSFFCISTNKSITKNDSRFIEHINHIINDSNTRDTFREHVPTSTEVVEYIKSMNKSFVSKSPNQRITTSTPLRTYRPSNRVTNSGSTHARNISDTAQITNNRVITPRIIDRSVNSPIYPNLPQSYYSSTTTPYSSNHLNNSYNSTNTPRSLDSNNAVQQYRVNSYHPRISNYNPSNVSFTGLRNFGNLCYRNSILQALMSLPSFVNDLCNDKLLMNTSQFTPHTIPTTSILHKFVSLIRDIKNRNTAIYPDEFNKTIDSRNEQFNNLQQHDAHEFLGTLLDDLNEDIRQAFISPTPFHTPTRNKTPSTIALNELSYATTGSSDDDVQQPIHNTQHNQLNTSNDTILPLSGDDESVDFDRVVNTSTNSIATTVTSTPNSATTDKNDLSSTSINISDEIDKPVTLHTNGVVNCQADIPVQSPTDTHHIHNLIYSISPVSRNLLCEVSSKLTCEQCNHVRDRPEHFFGLSLDFNESHLTDFNITAVNELRQVPIIDMLHSYFNQRQQEFKCNQSNCTSNSILIQPSITKLPRVLILHIKRFLPDFTGLRYKKVSRAVDIPKLIDMTEYCSNNVTPPTFNNDIVLPAHVNGAHLTSNSIDNHNTSISSKRTREDTYVDLNDDIDDTKRRCSIIKIDPDDYASRLCELKLKQRANKQELEMLELRNDTMSVAEVKSKIDRLLAIDEQLNIEIASMQSTREEFVQLQQAIDDSLDEIDASDTVETTHLSSTKSTLPSSQIKHVYQLSSIVLHNGDSAFSGHYVTDVYSDNTIQRYDDSKVMTNPPTYTTPKDAYLLFYSYKHYTTT